MLRHTPLRITVALAAATLFACSGDDAATDTGTATDTATDTGTDQVDDATTPTDAAATEGSTDAVDIEVGEGDTVRDVLTDAMGEQGADLDAAISAIPAQSRFEAVASQLEPEPTVEIDGGDVRLVFDGGSVSNATFDCIVAGSFVEPGETLTVVYPDGEQSC